MTLQETLRSGEQYLEAQNIDEADANAWLLFQFVTGIDRTRFLLDRSQEISEDMAYRYRELLEMRGRHIPLQYLTGEQEFMGLCFRVNENVLIPRQDTEILVEEALKRLTSGMKVLDLCTGSGCIAVSLAKLRRMGDAAGDELPPVDAADISEKALLVAAENVASLRANVRLIQSDLFAEISDIYDMIVSNPPYIPTAVIAGLSEEVRSHEPNAALDGREDGLHFYREIVRESGKYLREGGWLLFEIGYDQGGEVSRLLEKAGYTGIRIIKDLAGLDRVVLGRRENKEEIHV